MSSNKMKGILKGLRFISEIFDNEKEQEIQIGHPTDVKHVAHIGWDGPSLNSPSWMNEFKTVPGFSSAPLNLNGDIHNKEPDSSVKWVSEDSIKRGSRSGNSQGQEKGMPELPKSSRQQSMGNIRESHAKEKSDKPRQQKKSYKNSQSQPKDSSNGTKPVQQPMPTVTDSLQGSDSLPDIPKRSRSKKSKDASNVGGSSKLRSRAQPRDPNLNEGSPSRSISKSRNKQRPLEEDGQRERGSDLV